MSVQQTELPTPRQMVENPLSHLAFYELANTFITVNGISERALAKEASIERGRMSRLLAGARDFTEDEAARTRQALGVLRQKREAKKQRTK